MATPNMALNLPVVQSTLGPLWATLVNTALTTIDSHDHTSGKGVVIGTTVQSTVSVSTALAATGNDQMVICTTAAITITLPSPSLQRKPVTVKDFSGTAGSSVANAIVIAPNGSEKIENIAASHLLQSDFGAVKLISNGTDWFIL